MADHQRFDERRQVRSGAKRFEMLEVRSPPEPSLVDSLIRLIEAGHRLVLDRLDLIRYDLGELASRTLHGAALIGIGAVLVAGAWCALMTGAVLWLAQYLSVAGSVALVALLTAGIGVGMVAIGFRRAEYAGKEVVSDAVADALGKSVPARAPIAEVNAQRIHENGAAPP